MKTIKIISRLSLSLLFLAVLFAAGSASAEPWHTSNDLLGYAVPDECYAGIGENYPGGITPGDGFTTPVDCPPDSAQKTNDTYVWALTEEGNSLWFASAANVMCTTAGVFLGELSYGQVNIKVGEQPAVDEFGNPIWTNYLWDDGGPICGYYDYVTNQWVGEVCVQGTQSISVPYSVCEHGDSQVARDGLVMAQTGDWRPSKVFRYIKATEQLINLTEQIYAAGDGAVFDDLLGIRAAGSHNGVIFFAGGNQSYTGVSMFAFNADGTYLGYNTFTDYRQIRKMIVVNNRLYTGVAGSTGQGQILHWTGSAANPFSWQTVGRVLGSVTELSQYVDGNGQTRIVANAAMGLYVSPAMTWGRLFPWNASGWQNVWSASVYEPDTYSQLTYGPGAVAQLGEWMYWGTMHIPFHALYMNAQFRFGGIDNIENLPEEQQYGLYYGTLRATTIWRGRNLGQADQEIQLVYGESHLGAWDDTAGNFVATPTGWTPLNMSPPEYLHPYFGTPVGSSGFFNPNNNYSWTALAANFGDGTGDHLFFGTMDQTLIGTNDISDLGPSFDFPANDSRGADLWRFSLNGHGGATATTAAAEFTNGAGNIFVYGLRTMIQSDDGDKIYIGMANNGSLVHPWYSDPPTAEPLALDWFHGGWELRELSR